MIDTLRRMLRLIEKADGFQPRHIPGRLPPHIHARGNRLPCHHGHRNQEDELEVAAVIAVRKYEARRTHCPLLPDLQRR
jgi:hypothetical protein